MIAELIKPKDCQEIYDAFRQAQINRNNCEERKSGFYEYDLAFEEMKMRVGLASQEGLGLVLRDEKKLLVYILAYRNGQASQINDEVLRRVSVADDAIYVDQFLMEPNLPIYIAGRLLDTWTNIAMTRTNQGYFSAVPWKPWRNIASARFNFARGGKVSGFVSEENLSLAIFTNPLWRIGKQTREFEIDFKEDVA